MMSRPRKKNFSESSVESVEHDSGFRTQTVTEMSELKVSSQTETPPSAAVNIPMTGSHSVTQFSTVPRSSPFSPPYITECNEEQMVEFNDSTVFATVGEPLLENTIPDHNGDEELSETLQFQQESQQGASKPSAFLSVQAGMKNLKDLCDTNDKASRICQAVSEYYDKQFVYRWKEKTKGGPRKNQESNTISVIAALVIEKRGDFNVVVLTAGTKTKTECSFVQGDYRESSWGLCDGHAEAVCYRLANIYFTTEIYKANKGKESIFTWTSDGYKLTSGVEFHLFTSHPPCGFMAKRERYYLSWKRPFKGVPHNPQCSSRILINSYLGIQGPLSLLLVKPIYLSSLVVLRYESVDTLHDNYIEKRLEAFWGKLSAIPGLSEGGYYFHRPDVFIVDVHPNDLFRICFTPYIQEKRTKPSCDGELPHQESMIKSKPSRHHTMKIGGAVPDVLGNAGIETFIFSIDQGIGSQAERDKMIQLKHRVKQPSCDVKQRRLKFLKEARIRLSKAIDTSEALKILKYQIAEQIKTDVRKRSEIIDETVASLISLKPQKTDISELTQQVQDSKLCCGKWKESTIPSLQATFNNNLEYEKMQQDLQDLEQSNDLGENFYQDLMGCDWARYMETMQSELQD